MSAAAERLARLVQYAVDEQRAFPVCPLDGQPMTKQSKDTGRYGHLVKNDKEHSWHVYPTAFQVKEEE